MIRATAALAPRRLQAATRFLSPMGQVMGAIDVEQPKYDVLKTGDGYEVRRYEAATAVETVAPPEEENASFGRLARFIGVFGKPENAADQAIAMTAPVVTMQTNEGSRMQFILPADQHGQAPNPNSSQVRLVERPAASIFGVETFSGSWDTSAAAERASSLKTKLMQDGYTLDETVPWQYWRYNPPFTLPFLRTNEVAISLKSE
eukprot:TRINITY_DN23292_c0_g1_i1.p1 TRINITY_DN23292_c0_g1~~TRINITY_DN23292_c0_g1_i1.p1  ORF type:complete len:204 (-),score=46.81 TRINITY_DN23292_c0_g1_i1:109-720(-)